MRSLEPSTWIAVTARVMVAILTGLHVIGPIIIPALAILWIVLATIGRAATVRALSAGEPSTNWPGITALHVFRVALAFAAVLAFFGCGILIGEVLGDPAQHFAAAVLLATLALLFVTAAWSIANWFFSLAAIFSARDNAGFFRSLRDTTGLYHRESDSFLSAGFVFGMMRTLLVVVATVLSLLPVARLGVAHVRATILIVAAVTLSYFALADWLNVWRLAAYIGLAEPEPAPPPLAPSPESPLPPAHLPGEPASAADPLPEPPVPSADQFRTEN